MNETENPPAFPQIETTDRNHEFSSMPFAPDVHSYGGMTLRDYFAAKAIQSLIRNSLGTKLEECDTLAALSYEWADAMLAARQKGAA